VPGSPPRALLSALLLLAPALGAQTTARVVRSQANAWLVGSADLWATPTWGVQTELMYERSELGAAPQQIEYRLGAQRMLRSGARLAFGGTYIHSSPYGPFAARVASHEFRTWLQATADQRVGALSLTHRYRFEYRWVQRPLFDAAGERRASDDVSAAMRLRYQIRASLPLTSGASRRPLYATLAEEPFIALGPHTPINILEQNRAYLGAGVRWSPRLRTELGYLNQLIVRADGRQVEENHTLQVTLGVTRAAPRR
jgi:hypothetical protein